MATSHCLPNPLREVPQTSSQPTARTSRCQKLFHVSTLAGHQPPALPATASRRRFSQEHGKARSLAPGLTSAPATPFRGSEVICFLSPMERRTGPSPEPALQVQQRQAAPPHGTGGSGEALLPTAQTGLAAATGAAVSGSPPTPAQKHGVRAFPASETSPGAGHAARWHPVALMHLYLPMEALGLLTCLNPARA